MRLLPTTVVHGFGYRSEMRLSRKSWENRAVLLAAAATFLIPRIALRMVRVGFFWLVRLLVRSNALLASCKALVRMLALFVIVPLNAHGLLRYWLATPGRG